MSDRLYLSCSFGLNDPEHQELIEEVQKQKRMGWKPQQILERALYAYLEKGMASDKPMTIEDKIDDLHSKVDSLDTHAINQLNDLVPRLERMIARLNSLKGSVDATEIQDVVSEELSDDFLSSVMSDFKSRN